MSEGDDPTKISPPPYHVLMLPLSKSDKAVADLVERRRFFDRRLERDYLAKRYKAYHAGSATRGGDDNTKKQATNDLEPSKANATKSIWEGTSQVERELVQCCEMQEDHDGGFGTNNSFGRGALDREKEVRFVTILARDCNSLVSRSLAIAILERTLEAYLQEREDASLDEENESDNENDSSEGEEAPDDDTDDDWKPGSSKRRRSPRKHRQTYDSKQLNRKKKTKRQIPVKEEDDDYFETNAAQDPDRLDAFLASGGLRILNRWLAEASSTITVTALKPPPSSSINNTKRPAVVTKPSPMRPLALPILGILEYMPFNKKLVVESKINKQIKKLGKHVDTVLEARARGKHRKDDLEGWAIATSEDETAAITEVQEAIDGVKRTWEEMATKRSADIADPFEDLKSQMRDRLDVLVRYEAGEIEKPPWLVETDKSKDTKKKKNVLVKPNTKQLAAKERQSEREELRKRLKACEDESRKRLAKLREQLRKRRELCVPSQKPVERVSHKRVKWKDGLVTKNQRNRRLLEEVFVFRAIEDTTEDSPKSGGLELTGNDITAPVLWDDSSADDIL